MKIELKNIKVMTSMSEKTHCYSASLYIDGKKIGEVGNDGHGGPDRFHGDRAAFEAADAWVQTNMPVETYHGMDLQPTLETVCGDIVDTHLITRDLKTALRSKILMVEPGSPAVLETRFKGVRKIEQKHLDHIAKKYPQATILNTLPFEEALKLYRAGTAA